MSEGIPIGFEMESAGCIRAMRAAQRKVDKKAMKRYKEAEQRRKDRRHSVTEGSIKGTMNPSQTQGMTRQVSQTGITRLAAPNTSDTLVPVSDQPKKVYPLSIHKRGKDEV